MIYINGSPLNVTIFPDHTSQVWQVEQLKIPSTDWVHIVWDFQHEAEFMHISQLKMLLDEGIDRQFGSTLRIKYLPYGRQDKMVSNNTTFALRSFAKALNSLKFDEIVIHDPHSQLAILLILNSRDVYPIDEVSKVFDLTLSSIMCFPDKGATAKYKHLYREPYTWGEKVRDQITSKILKYELKNPSCVHEQNVLIVDDICDGGATFVILAKELLANGVSDINLFVTHGIFSKGLKPLFDAGIKRIFTQDGEVSEHQNQLTYRKL